MRKITRESVKAFKESRNFYSGNTWVVCIRKNHSETGKACNIFRLHGNTIATYEPETGELFISHCGWETNTTKERLNGILDFFGLPGIYQKNFRWLFANGEEFTGTKVFQTNPEANQTRR